MGGEEKAETGDWRPERKGRATGEGRGDFGWWIQSSALIIQNFAACAAFFGEAVFLQAAVGFICRHGGNRPNWW